MSSIAVVHLVRRGNDPAHLQRFLRSYRRYDSGQSHRLILMLKGYEGSLPFELRSQLEGIEFSVLTMPDAGFDLSAYLLSARLLGDEFSHLLFLNSYSEPLVDGWLQKLYAPLHDGRAGATGATGSWQSHFDGTYDGPLKFFFAARDHYALYPHEHWLRRLALARLGAKQHLGFWHSLKHPYFFSRNFDPFPNPHLRTNAFMISRELLMRLYTRPIKHKLDAYAFESGRGGLSRFVLNQGLELMVIGRNGEAYCPKQWRDSRTFWSHGQDNLLIADNRTRQYEAGTEEERAQLQRIAWGTPQLQLA